MSDKLQFVALSSGKLINNRKPLETEQVSGKLFSNRKPLETEQVGKGGKRICGSHYLVIPSAPVLKSLDHRGADFLRRGRRGRLRSQQQGSIKCEQVTEVSLPEVATYPFSDVSTFKYSCWERRRPRLLVCIQSKYRIIVTGGSFAIHKDPRVGFGVVIDPTSCADTVS